MKSPPLTLIPSMIPLWQALARRFGSDASLALLLLITLVSGGTEYPLSVRLICPRGTDGRALVGTLRELLRRLRYRWRGKFIDVSHATLPAIFAAKRVAVVIADVDRVNPALVPVMSQLRLQGRAEGWIRDENGQPHRLKVTGPTAVIQIVTPGHKKEDTVDDPTWLTCRLSDSDEQIAFLANAAIEGFDRHCGLDRLQGLVDDVRRTVNLSGVTAKRSVKNCWLSALATVSPRPNHLPATIQHVARLAAMFTLARSPITQTSPSHSPKVAEGNRDDVVAALALILDSNAVDDREVLQEKHLHMLGWLRQMELGSPPLPLDRIIRRLNSNVFWEGITAANQADPSLRIPVAPSHVIWTRRIAERSLKALLNVGLVERDDSREPYLWHLPISATLYRPNSLFTLMALAVESAKTMPRLNHSGSTAPVGQTVLPTSGMPEGETHPMDRDYLTTGEGP